MMVQNDSRFLQNKGLMDYSLLLFIETKKSPGGREKENSINREEFDSLIGSEKIP